MSYLVKEYFMGRFSHSHAEFVEREDAESYIRELGDEPGVEYEILPVMQGDV